MMTKDTQTYIDMLRKFGSDIGLPKLDVDRLIEGHRKNIDALSQSAKVAVKGTQSVAEKQRDVLEAGLREATSLARAFQPLGNPKENIARQTEFARKVFDIAVEGTKESAQLARQSTGDAVKIIQSRLKESLEEIRGSVSRPEKSVKADK
jgi:phasin family protein